MGHNKAIMCVLTLKFAVVIMAVSSLRLLKGPKIVLNLILMEALSIMNLEQLGCSFRA